MPIKMQCPNPACRVVAAVRDGAVGRAVRCKRCGHKFTIPGPASGPPTTIDRYEVRELLGEGASGRVYRAYDPRLDRCVALKVLRPELTVLPEAAARFLREARAAAKLRHRHIVTVYDAAAAGAVHFIASAFIQGQTLSSVIPEGGLESRRAAELAGQLASALGYAHQQGVLHRDVKPQNMLLDEQGFLYLTDFGLAGWTREEGTRLTQLGTVMGTPAYMAPEQATGDTAVVGTAADLYAAGVVLYQMLTGCLPFAAEHPAALVYQIVHVEPPPPSQRRPGLDAALEAICLKAMAKKPAERYASGEEMAAALAARTLPVAEILHTALPMPALPAAVAPAVAPARPPSVWDKETLLPGGAATLTAERQLPDEIVNSFGGRLKLLKPGTFTMGAPAGEAPEAADDKPARPVRITRPFYLAVLPVTQEEYVRVTGEKNPSWFSAGGGGKDELKGLDSANFPVEYVSWYEAVSFCGVLNQDPKRPAGWKYALPTEAQWEYACRAGGQTAYPFGGDPRGLGDHAWFNRNAGGRPHEVGARRANPWGFHDLLGNVWEWCADWYGQYPQPAPGQVFTDPQGPYRADCRALRGGSWFSPAECCRSACRRGFPPASRYGGVGLRVCLVAEG